MNIATAVLPPILLRKHSFFLSYSFKIAVSNHGLLDSHTKIYEDDSSLRRNYSKVWKSQSTE